MTDKTTLPGAAGRVAERYPDVWDAYTDLGEACAAAGPLTGQTQRLVKLALAIAAGAEGAVHSHVRRALDEGIDAEQLIHVALLAMPTIGFPASVAALTWIKDVTGKGL